MGTEMKLKMLYAGLLAALAFNATAADQIVTVTTSPVADSDNHFIGVTAVGDGLLSDGLDVITFDGLAPGVYNFSITISAQNLSIDDTLSTLNGVYGTTFGNSTYVFYGVSNQGASPFVLNLYGTAYAGALYSGEVTVSAVPEPETYGMLLAGLGLAGFAARRKGAKKAV
jgi:hypothetical protein